MIFEFLDEQALERHDQACLFPRIAIRHNAANNYWHQGLRRYSQQLKVPLFARYSSILKRYYVATFYTSCALHPRPGRNRRQFSRNLTILRANWAQRAFLFARLLRRRLIIPNSDLHLLHLGLVPVSTRKKGFFHPELSARTTMDPIRPAYAPLLRRRYDD